MMILISLITIILELISSMTYLQQAHYHLNEFVVYYKYLYKRQWWMYLVTTILAFFNLWYLDLVVAVLYVLSWRFFVRRKIVKLNYTNRIKRTLVLSVLIYLSLLFTINYGFIVFISPILNIPIYIIISLIEKIILSTYVKKTKDKIRKICPEIIAVTGSAGKTSTKSIIYELINGHMNTLKSPKSYNTIGGLSKFINNDLEIFTEMLVLEYGASYKDDIKKLCDFINVDYSVITNIASCHKKTFKSIDNIINEKMTLLQRTNKLCVVNNDDINIRNSLNKLNYNCRVVKVGKSKDSDYIISNEVVCKEGITFKLNGLEIKSNLIGYHNIYNISFAVALIKELKIKELNDYLIQDKLSVINQTNNRLEMKNDLKGNIILDDSYNSNYFGFCNALEVLKMYENRVLITPGIVDSDNDINLSLVDKIIDSCDKVYIIESKSGNVIYDGLINKGYEKVIKVKSFKEAIVNVNSSTVLIENDLPDIYLI